MLAIASGELLPGKRLPSTRALGKRFHLNANTVSAAYRQLQGAGWVESIHGSGVFVRAKQGDPTLDGDALDCLVLPFVRAARAAGFSADVIRNRTDYWLVMRPKRFVFVHPERELRAIVADELRRAMSWTVEACDADPRGIAQYAGDSIFVTVPSKQRAVRVLLPAAAEVLTLQMRRVDEALAQYLPVSPEVLLIVASAWPGFLRIARAVLTAAGFDPDAVLFRDTRAKGWERNLNQASAVVCDVVTFDSIPDGMRKIIFPLVSDAGIARLKSFERCFAE